MKTIMKPDNLPILQTLSVSKREELLRHTTTLSVSAGTVLFEQGDVPNFQLVVLMGSAHLFARSTEGREVLIEVVRPADLIIPAAVMTGAPFLMQARVPESSSFLLIQAEPFRQAVASEPVLAREVIGSLSHQFRRMVRQVKNLKLRSASERVGSYILALADRQETPDKVVLPYEKNLIASELGIARESFSRALSNLERLYIRVEGQLIHIKDRAGLMAESKPDPLIDGLDRDSIL